MRRPLTRRVPSQQKPFITEPLPQNKNKYKGCDNCQLHVLQELLKNAAKMRIRRMIAKKKRRTDLAVPAMVREQWDKGTLEKNEMAQLLMDSNWDKDPTVD